MVNQIHLAGWMLTELGSPVVHSPLIGFDQDGRPLTLDEFGRTVTPDSGFWCVWHPQGSGITTREQAEQSLRARRSEHNG